MIAEFSSPLAYVLLSLVVACILEQFLQHVAVRADASPHHVDAVPVVYTCAMLAECARTRDLDAWFRTSFASGDQL